MASRVCPTDAWYCTPSALSANTIAPPARLIISLARLKPPHILACYVTRVLFWDLFKFDTVLRRRLVGWLAATCTKFTIGPRSSFCVSTSNRNKREVNEVNLDSLRSLQYLNCVCESNHASNDRAVLPGVRMARDNK